MKRSLFVAALLVTVASAGCGTSRQSGGRDASACGICHGFPPATVTSGGAHPQPTADSWVAADCSTCHPTTVDPTGAIIPAASGGTHRNGTVEASGHPIPWDSTLHGPAALASIDVCRSCHGPDLRGGSARSCEDCHPGWQSDCGFCHDPRAEAPTFHTRISLSPAATNPPQCSACHGAGYSESGQTVNATTHWNGSLEIPGVTCVSCHGNGAGSATAASPREAAPPVDKYGRAASAQVGAHVTHLNGKNFSNGFACASCHPTVGTYAQVHANGAPNVAFSAAVVAGGSYASGTCTATYCHAAVGGGSAPSPSWSATSIACNACHGIPTSSTGTGKHTTHIGRSSSSATNGSTVQCLDCHPGYTATTVNKTVHVNGTRNVTPKGGTYSGGQCSSIDCHGNESW
jgi:predicted CxxxxCH...CXXCH cytochrome family protein